MSDSEQRSGAAKFLRRHFVISGKSSEKKRQIRQRKAGIVDTNTQTQNDAGGIDATLAAQKKTLKSRLSLKSKENTRTAGHGNFILIKDKFMGPDPEKTRSLKAPKARVWRALVAELIATALFVFFATGGVVIALSYDPSAGALANLIVAFTQAFALQIGVYYAANISGGHLNPVVTLSFVLVGRMRFIVAFLYWIAQIVGAIIGSALLQAVIPDAFEGNLGTTTLAAGYSGGRGVLLEAIMTFTLVSTVYATAIDKIGFGKSAPFAIGLTIFLDIIIGWRFTGSSMNPARTLGPAIVSNTWTNHWVYWVGPIVGSLIAAWIYDFLLISRPANKNPFAAGTRMETEGRPVTVMPAPNPLPDPAPVNDPSENDTGRTFKIPTPTNLSRVNSKDTKIDVAPSPQTTPLQKRIN